MSCSAAHQQSGAKVLAPLSGGDSDFYLLCSPMWAAAHEGITRFSFLGCYGGESVICVDNVNSTE